MPTYQSPTAGDQKKVAIAAATDFFAEPSMSNTIRCQQILCSTAIFSTSKNLNNSPTAYIPAVVKKGQSKSSSMSWKASECGFRDYYI